MFLVVAEGREDDLHFVAHVVGEERAQRAVNHARGEDGLLGRAAFAAEVAAGNTAGRVLLFLEVHTQREEVNAFAGVLAHGGGGEDNRFAHARGDSRTGLAGQLAGFDGDFLAGYGDGVTIGGSHLGYQCFHGGPPSSR